LNNKILITRPQIPNDEATRHTYRWADPLIKYAKSLGYEIYDYRKTDVTYDNVSNALSLISPDIYIHFGHGCPANLIGQGNCIVTNGSQNYNVSNQNYLDNYVYRMTDDIACDNICKDIPSNVNLLTNKTVITYSCHSAKRLGVCALKNGAKSYMGFEDFLIFIVDEKGTESIFVECLMEYTYSMLNGETIQTSVKRTLDKFDEKIRMYKDKQFLAKILLWDREVFKVLGNDYSTVFSEYII
jgi:hypothetical protein